MWCVWKDCFLHPVAKRNRSKRGRQTLLSAQCIQAHAPSINIIFILHGLVCLWAAEHTDVKMHSSVSTHTVCMCIPCAGAPVGDWLWCYLLVNCDQHLNTLTPRHNLEELLSLIRLPVSRSMSPEIIKGYSRNLQIAEGNKIMQHIKSDSESANHTVGTERIQTLSNLSLFLMKPHVKIKRIHFLPHQATLAPRKTQNLRILHKLIKKNQNWHITCRSVFRVFAVTLM